MLQWRSCRYLEGRVLSLCQNHTPMHLNIFTWCNVTVQTGKGFTGSTPKLSCQSLRGIGCSALQLCRRIIKPIQLLSLIFPKQGSSSRSKCHITWLQNHRHRMQIRVVASDRLKWHSSNSLIHHNMITIANT